MRMEEKDDRSKEIVIRRTTRETPTIVRDIDRHARRPGPRTRRVSTSLERCALETTTAAVEETTESARSRGREGTRAAAAALEDRKR